jgi:branched-chain amino acid transport system permease protein
MLALLPQLLLTGITVGSIYALVALGFVLIYTVTGILNFAQGEFSMLSALLCATLLAWHLPLGLAALCAVMVVCAVGAGTERLAIQPAFGGHPLTLIIITFGVSMAFRGIALMLWGADPYTIPEFTPGPALIVLGGVLVRQAM